jgi:hypothetical protein
MELRQKIIREPDRPVFDHGVPVISQVFPDMAQIWRTPG